MNPPPASRALRSRSAVRSAFAGMLVLALGVAALPRYAAAATNDISLAAAFPPDLLEQVLLAPGVWKPFPPAADRAGWEKLPAGARSALTSAGEAALSQPIPPLPATLYLGFARDGDRGRYEGPYFDRRRRLHRLVLAECAEFKGRFLDEIANTLWAICEESSWSVPAHIGAQPAGHGLPEVRTPVLDLFAAQTGSSVAWTVYLLSPSLDRVSPRIPTRATHEVQRRILEPFLSRNWGWLGFSSRNPESRPNNWNPWINGNVLTAALLLEADTDHRVTLVHRVLRSLDRFLQPHPTDGGCDEGPGYWSRAGGSVLDNLDLLHDASQGRIDYFSHPLIQEMGRYIHRVHIAGDWYVPLGDCAARSGIDHGTVHRYGRRIGDRDLQALAAHGVDLPRLIAETGGLDLGRALRLLEDLPDLLSASATPPPLVRDAWLGSEDLQTLIARDRGGTSEGLFVAAWGAHNAQSHNHNDVGNLIFFADGLPVFVDLGAPTYTAKTFSNQRYQIPAMQSDWHNLPSINGVQQSAGRRFAAREVDYRTDDEAASLSMDIASAWPDEARVRRWRRTVRLERGKALHLIEDFELTEAHGTTAVHFITPRTPEPGPPGTLRLPPPVGTDTKSRAVILHFDPEHLRIEAEPFDVNDARLASTWGPRLTRLRVTARQPRLEDRWTFRLERQP